MIGYTSGKHVLEKMNTAVCDAPYAIHGLFSGMRVVSTTNQAYGPVILDRACSSFQYFPSILKGLSSQVHCE